MDVVRPEQHAASETDRPDRLGLPLWPWATGASASSNPFLWPLIAAASASQASASFLQSVANSLARRDSGEDLPEPAWATANTVVLELPTMRLRDFSAQAQGTSALLCAPYALHGATIADFAPDHSIVEALRGAGQLRLFVTDWRSAAPEMRYLSIDSYLADLNVAVDTVGSPVDLIGLCHGGWMALLYAARFPAKVRRLVLVGAPVDVRAGESHLSRLVAQVPFATFESLIVLGGGRALGQHMLDHWAPAIAAQDAGHVLQPPAGIRTSRLRELKQRFDAWYAWTVNLPGAYFLDVVLRLYKENQIAEGRFVALGRPINLADVRVPIFMLGARDDEIVAPEQLFATARLVGTPKADIEMATEPCSHLSLFLGVRTIEGVWRRIGLWLGRDASLAQAS